MGAEIGYYLRYVAYITTEKIKGGKVTFRGAEVRSPGMLRG